MPITPLAAARFRDVVRRRRVWRAYAPDLGGAGSWAELISMIVFQP